MWTPVVSKITTTGFSTGVEHGSCVLHGYWIAVGKQIGAQWGAVLTGTSSKVSFQLAYTNTCYIVVATRYTSAAARVVTILKKDNTGFNYSNVDYSWGTQYESILYFSIGKQIRIEDK